MRTVRDVVISGFNEYKATQQQLGETRFSLTLFNTESRVVYTNEAHADDLTEDHYLPRGMTALVDATGDAIRALEYALADAKKKTVPKKIVFVVYTDGGENSSRRWTGEQLAQLIEHKRTHDGWEFVFLGADQDAWGQAQSLGFAAAGNTVSFAGTREGVYDSFVTLSAATTQYRGHDAARATTNYFSDQPEPTDDEKT